MTLPNFVIIGAAKAGTTWLHARLGAHPDIFMCARQEPSHFAAPEAASERDVVVDPADYEALFARAGPATIRAEVSPVYLRIPACAARIDAGLPGVKLLASLRHPVDRAYSDYLMLARKGRETRPPAEAIVAGSNYVEGSLYAAQLAPYLDRFDAERLMLIRFEDIRDAPHETAGRICTWLGVRPERHPIANEARNRGGLPRRAWLHRLFTQPALVRIGTAILPLAVQRAVDRLKESNLAAPPPLEPDERARIAGLFQADLDRLEARTGLDIRTWRE